MHLADVKDALSHFPSGVVVVTTRDDQGKAWGFTASSFCSVSMRPLLVSVCLADSADCFQAFGASAHFAVNIMGSDHSELATRFATRGADKFAGESFDADLHGMPRFAAAVATLSCATHRWILCGDHAILVGEVRGVHRPESKGSALLYYRRKFWSAGTAAA